MGTRAVGVEDFLAVHQHPKRLALAEVPLVAGVSLAVRVGAVGADIAGRRAVGGGERDLVGLAGREALHGLLDEGAVTLDREVICARAGDEPAPRPRVGVADHRRAGRGPAHRLHVLVAALRPRERAPLVAVAARVRADVLVLGVEAPIYEAANRRRHRRDAAVGARALTQGQDRVEVEPGHAAQVLRALGVERGVHPRALGRAGRRRAAVAADPGVLAARVVDAGGLARALGRLGLGVHGRRLVRDGGARRQQAQRERAEQHFASRDKCFT